MEQRVDHQGVKLVQKWHNACDRWILLIQLDGVPDFKLDIELGLDELEDWVSCVSLDVSEGSLVVVLTVWVISVADLIVLEDPVQLLLFVVEKAWLERGSHTLCVHLIESHSL